MREVVRENHLLTTIGFTSMVTSKEYGSEKYYITPWESIMDAVVES